MSKLATRHRIGIAKLSEYNSKRNLRPKREFADECERLFAAGIHKVLTNGRFCFMPKLHKTARYELRAVYGSKY